LLWILPFKQLLELDMKRTLVVLSLAIGIVVLLAGCASAPTAEITATKAAITNAQIDDVRTYAAESLKAAEDELSTATAEIQTQENKFFLSRDYKQATEMLKSAKDLAEKALTDAQANKMKAKTDTETLLASLPQLMDEAKKTLAKAPRGKDTRADLEAMQNDLKVAEESIEEAKTAMSSEKYNEALAKATSAKEAFTQVIDQVKAALEKGRR
jgi:hypothetical protein